MPVAGLVNEYGLRFCKLSPIVSFEDYNGICLDRKCSRAFFEERIGQVVILGITGNEIRAQIG